MSQKSKTGEGNKMKQGIMASTDIANMGPHDDTPVESKKSLRPMGTVYLGGELR